MLPEPVRSDVMRETMRITGGRVLVMAGIAEQSLPRALSQALAAKEAGVDVLLSTPPYSYSVGPDQVHAYYRDLADKTDMPVMVYHNDDITVRPDLSLIVRLSQTPGIIGVKAFCDFNLLQKYSQRASRPDRFVVFSSSIYHLAPCLLLGFRHFLVGTPGNLSPILCARLLQDAREGNWDAVGRNHNRLVELFNVLSVDTEAGDVTVKFILSELGLCKPYVSPPLRPLTSDEQGIVRKAMKDYADILN